LAHFGFLTLPVLGHLFPVSALARELKGRGNRVTFFCIRDSHEFLNEIGLDAVVIGEAERPLGHTRRVTETLGRLKGTKGVTYTIETLCADASVHFAELPRVIQNSGVHAMVVDQFAMAGSTVAEHLRLPYVHVAAALLANTEEGVPPINVGLKPGGSLKNKFQISIASTVVSRILAPVKKAVNGQRSLWRLPLYQDFINERLSGGPQICQEPPSFEFPRRKLPANFHFVGPLHKQVARSSVAFPWERLDGRPLIYASMGTLQNGLDWVFKAFAEGCAELDAQLVLSFGGNFDPANFAGLPGDPIMVQFAPQLELLDRAAVCITHAGLNTALESLTRGVPMVAIPITNDQPGVAARIAWSGAGRSVLLKNLTPKSLGEAVRDVIDDPSYRSNARRLQQEITSLDSLTQASEIVEGILN
jgi:zeaxanthin glucosyltransferase